MIGIDNKGLCNLHELRIDKLEKKIDKVTEDIENIKEKVSDNETNNARYQEIISSFDKRFEQVEKCLESVVSELKSISTSITDIRARSELGDERLKDKLDGNLKGHIANNKELYAIITTLITLLSYVIKNWR